MIRRHTFKIEMEDQVYEINVEIEASKDLYGVDADGGRGVECYSIDNMEYELPELPIEEDSKKLEILLVRAIENYEWEF